MVYRRFRILCIFRVILLAVTLFGFVYFFTSTTLYTVTVVTGAAVVYQVYALLRYVDRTNRELSQFFETVKYEDFSEAFGKTGLGSSFDELRSAFRRIVEKFHKTRAEREEQFRYLQTVVEHIGIGVISYRKDGEVELVNKAAKKMLKVPHLNNIKALEPFSRELVKALLEIGPGEKTLVRVEDNREVMQLMIHATEFIMREQNFTLVTIQNIQSELEEKEIDSWQNLIRILTHEIMNSVTPIASLASTVNSILPEVADEHKMSDSLDAELIGDIHSAIQTIEKRSQGLIHFVESYRKLTRIPKPEFMIFEISSLFERVGQLMGPQIAEKGISFTHRVEPATLELTADPELIEQVLINLLLNAMHAVEGRTGAAITLAAHLNERGRVVIVVIDNGAGILEEVQEKIFIPFFTTRQDGSGIGLSLSRQIMRLHQGTISVHSKPDVETVFSLRF